MKLAVILPGMVRTFRKCAPNFHEIFAPYDPDIYASIWDVSGNSKGKDYDNVTLPWIIEAPLDFASLLSAYPFRKLRVEHWHPWLESIQPAVREFCATHPAAARQMLTHGILSQYYQIHQAFNLIDDPDQYDVIVRWRFDISPDPPIDFEKARSSPALHVCSLNKTRSFPSDHFFFGRPAIMSRVCNLFHWLLTMPPCLPRKYGSPHKVYSPELILHRLLSSFLIPLRVLGIKPNIIR